MSQRGYRPSGLQLGLVCSALVVMATVALVATRQVTPQPPPSTTLSAQDRTTLARLCVECHDLGLAVDARHTRREWNGVLESMLSRGATWTDEDFTLALNVLTRVSGLVQINRADAQEIAAVLKLTAKEADAIVAYRTVHGPFSDIESVAKVPGVDPKKLGDVAEFVLFQLP